MPPGRVALPGICVGLLTTNGGDAHAEEAGADGGEAGTDADEVRQVEVLRPEFGSHQRTEAGVLDAARGDVAGVQLVGGPLVFALAVGHRTDERDVFHRPGHVGPVFGDLDAADGGVDGPGGTTVVRPGLGSKVSN